KVNPILLLSTCSTCRRAGAPQGPCATWACAMKLRRGGVAEDKTKAAGGMRRPPGRACPLAQCNLGFFYDNRGVGVAEEDAAWAVEWYERAAEQGYPRAQCNLGYCYEERQGREGRTRPGPRSCTARPPNSGSSVGQCNLGYCVASRDSACGLTRRRRCIGSRKAAEGGLRPGHVPAG
ncbi:MAG: tetratricopeptide repeat protein, partial [Flavonifractor plautii]